MQAYVNEFKEKKEIKKATNEFYKREREREIVTYTKIKIISLADSSKSYHFHGDSSCSQSELPCSCVLKFPNQFPKRRTNLSIRLGSYILFGSGMFVSLDVPCPLGPALSPSDSSRLCLTLVSSAELSKSSS